jgi:hypothetical protein
MAAFTAHNPLIIDVRDIFPFQNLSVANAAHFKLEFIADLFYKKKHVS